MTSRDFCYWLNGYFELGGDIDLINGEQLDLIKRHLAMVFVHEIDPSFGDQKEKLQEVHDKAPEIERSPHGCLESIKFTC